MSATDATTQQKNYTSRMYPSNLAKRSTLIISNKEMKDIMETVKSLKESGVSKTIEN